METRGCNDHFSDIIAVRCNGSGRKNSSEFKSAFEPPSVIAVGLVVEQLELFHQWP